MDGLNLLAEQQQILPGDTAELPEQLQLGDGGGLGFTSQSCHTTLGPLSWMEGCHHQAGKKMEGLP